MSSFYPKNDRERIDLSIVIPAYNEERRLPRSLESVSKYLQQQNYTYEVIVVDDGSADRTSTVVKNFQKDHPQLQLIRLPKNRGKGFCVRTGILESKGCFVIFTDADLATPIKEVEKILPIWTRDLMLSSDHVDTRILKSLNPRTGFAAK